MKPRVSSMGTVCNLLSCNSQALGWGGEEWEKAMASLSWCTFCSVPFLFLSFIILFVCPFRGYPAFARYNLYASGPSWRGELCHYLLITFVCLFFLLPPPSVWPQHVLQFSALCLNMRWRRVKRWANRKGCFPALRNSHWRFTSSEVLRRLNGK